MDIDPRGYLELDRRLGREVPHPHEDPTLWVDMHRALQVLALRAADGDGAANTTLRELDAELRSVRGEDTPPRTAAREDEHAHSEHYGDPCYGATDTTCTAAPAVVVTFTDPVAGRMTVAFCGACHTVLHNEAGVEIEFTTTIPYGQSEEEVA